MPHADVKLFCLQFLIPSATFSRMDSQAGARRVFNAVFHRRRWRRYGTASRINIDATYREAHDGPQREERGSRMRIYKLSAMSVVVGLTTAVSALGQSPSASVAA